MRFHFSEAISVFMSTLPFTLIRAGLLLAFAVASFLYFAIFLVVYMILHKVPIIGLIVAVIGISGLGFGWKFFKEYFLFMLSAAHVAVIAEILTSGKVRAVGDMVSYGKQKVTDQFGQITVLFAVDQLVIGILHAFTATVESLTSWLPEALTGGVKLVLRVLSVAVENLSKAILCYAFAKGEKNLWKASRDGLLLYVQAWQPILTTAGILTVTSYVGATILFVVFSVPAWVFAAALSEKLIMLAYMGYFAAFIVAWLVKATLLDTLSMCWMIVTFYEETKSLSPDEAKAELFSKLTPKWAELSTKAAAA